MNLKAQNINQIIIASSEGVMTCAILISTITTITLGVTI